MTARAKKASRRYSREQGQEDRSEAQLRARLAEAGWPCERIGRDLGEDLLVRIYEDGASTGLSFYVQLKSVASYERIKRKKVPSLGYPVAVKDLLHWEVSTSLVVLVIWDVEERMGFWRPIPEIIEELDRSEKEWRGHKTAVASVPLTNGTDDKGLELLRCAVADHSLPVVPKPERAELRLCFPTTAEGAAALIALKRALDEDEGVEVIVPKVEYPEWHRRIYGDFRGPAQVSVGRSEVSFVMPVRVDLESSLGSACLSYVELRPRLWGRRKKVLSNEQQGLPVELIIDLTDDGGGPRLRVARLAGGIEEVQEAVRFAFVMAGGGVRCRLTLLSGRWHRAEFELEGPADEVAAAALKQWEELVDKLAFIQQRLSPQHIVIHEDGISHADAAIIDRVFTIMSRGEELAFVPLSFTVTPGARPPGQRDLANGSAVVSVATSDSVSMRFLNAAFETGAVRMVLQDPVGFFAECERQLKAAQRANDRSVRIEKVPVRLEYPKWVPEHTRWERLTELAIRQEGYVALQQARWIGYSDDVFLAFVPAGKTERVTSDVFRLTHFPRSDHEDFVALWLQTDRQGVLSHDTALLLHELSDISPRRRHITVPLGWDPGDRQLDANVVLYHGHVAEDEKRWLGPVPYTAPLRTLYDCVASHVSPDLIDQAITDGLRRGMFTESQLPPDRRRGAA
jgi:hypothetical protein